MTVSILVTSRYEQATCFIIIWFLDSAEKYVWPNVESFAVRLSCIFYRWVWSTVINKVMIVTSYTSREIWQTLWLQSFYRQLSFFYLALYLLMEYLIMTPTKNIFKAVWQTLRFHFFSTVNSFFYIIIHLLMVHLTPTEWYWYIWSCLKKRDDFNFAITNSLLYCAIYNTCLWCNYSTIKKAAMDFVPTMRIWYHEASCLQATS